MLRTVGVDVPDYLCKPEACGVASGRVHQVDREVNEHVTESGAVDVVEANGGVGVCPREILGCGNNGIRWFWRRKSGQSLVHLG